MGMVDGSTIQKLSELCQSRSKLGPRQDGLARPAFADGMLEYGIVRRQQGPTKRV
jgi:hypothetical protein